MYFKRQVFADLEGYLPWRVKKFLNFIISVLFLNKSVSIRCIISTLRYILLHIFSPGDNFFNILNNLAQLLSSLKGKEAYSIKFDANIRLVKTVVTLKILLSTFKLLIHKLIYSKPA